MTDASQNTPQDETPETAAATPNHAAAPTAPAAAGQTVKQPEQPAHPSATQPIVIEQKNSGGKGMAAGALVLSLIALGFGGFLFVQGQNALKTHELSMNQALDKAAVGNSENGVLLQNTLLKQDDLNKQVGALALAQAENGKRLEGINAAYAELLKGRVNWLVDEVEVTLNTASQQLLLSGNVPAAVGVLENIDQRLSRFEQPDLLPIKQAVSADLAALKTRPHLNVAATSLRLDRLQAAVSGLPLLVDTTLQEGKTTEQPSQAANFWQRTWENTVGMVKGMVEVRKLESNDAMLMAPEQVYFVRENLRLRLMDARLALLQHNGEIFQNDLNATEAAVRQYFDADSPTAQAWLQELNELKGLEIRMVSDDALKNSLTAVRNYQNSVRTAVPVTLPDNTAAGTASTASAALANQTIQNSQPAASTPVAAPVQAASEPVSASAVAASAAKPAAASAASAPAKGN